MQELLITCWFQFPIVFFTTLFSKLSTLLHSNHRTLTLVSLECNTTRKGSEPHTEENEAFVKSLSNSS